MTYKTNERSHMKKVYVTVNFNDKDFWEGTVTYDKWENVPIRTRKMLRKETNWPNWKIQNAVISYPA